MKNSHLFSIAACVALLVPTQEAQADTYLATGATVVEVTNTSSLSQTFAMRVTGGSGPCTGGVWIHFQINAYLDADAQKRAYDLALAALANDKPVNILSFTDSSCVHASYISVLK